MRQIVLDTETTGLEPEQGHRIIEIGCVELVNRRPTGHTFHRYVCPERPVDAGAAQIHGLSDEFLADKPRFGDVVGEFMDFVSGAELVIHNAAFDIGFLDCELGLLGAELGHMSERCQVMDTLTLARELHPGQSNSLDALCKRYEVDNSQRELHGALLDARLLAEVYLAMTGGQAALGLDGHGQRRDNVDVRRVDRAGLPQLSVIRASAAECQAHEAQLEAIDRASGGQCLWRRLDAEGRPAVAAQGGS